MSTYEKNSTFLISDGRNNFSVYRVQVTILKSENLICAWHCLLISAFNCVPYKHLLVIVTDIYKRKITKQKCNLQTVNYNKSVITNITFSTKSFFFSPIQLSATKRKGGAHTHIVCLASHAPTLTLSLLTGRVQLPFCSSFCSQKNWDETNMCWASKRSNYKIHLVPSWENLFSATHEFEERFRGRKTGFPSLSHTLSLDC